MEWAEAFAVAVSQPNFSLCPVLLSTLPLPICHESSCQHASSTQASQPGLLPRNPTEAVAYKVLPRLNSTHPPYPSQNILVCFSKMTTFNILINKFQLLFRKVLGQAWLLTLWEAEAGRSLQVKSSRLACPTW